MDFLRFWVGHEFPRLIRALDSIQAEVFVNTGQPFGDYKAFATILENFMLDPPLGALDEYGIPVQTAARLRNHISISGDLDAVLAQVRELHVSQLPLAPFERTLIEEAQRHL